MVFILALARELRVIQWVKNLAIFTAIIFTGQLFNPELFRLSLWAFISFSLLSSGGYIINDIADLSHDRAHPTKKYRPLARGLISPSLAILLGIILIFSSLYLAFSITPAFFLLSIFYLVLQFFYSITLKNIAILDILVIAAGYFLRVLGGEFATGFHISVWLILTAISLSLFLAIGKRRAELTLLFGTNEYQKIRQSLTHYSEKLLDQYLSVFMAATFISYSLFTFLDKFQGTRISFDFLSWGILPTFSERKWLMVTIPFVIFGLMRYLQDIYEKQLGERPERVLFKDRVLLANVFIWGVSVVIILYVLS